MASTDVPVFEPRTADVGGMAVQRHLPRMGLRTVGPWCFADEMGPVVVTEQTGLDVGPHPHAGLQTVTWLLDGEVSHSDSLGSEQLVVPGQLNLMTAGRGVVHAEESVRRNGRLHGVQLWVAQPEHTRDGAARFSHHADLPVVETADATVTVLAGRMLSSESPARYDSPIIGADAVLRPGQRTWPLDPDFEHVVVVLEGEVWLDGAHAGPHRLAWLGTGRGEVGVTCRAPARILLLGGAPLGEPIMMWWNFVARTREEITAMHASWTCGSDRFGDVRSALPRIPAPVPPWSTATPA